MAPDRFRGRSLIVLLFVALLALGPAALTAFSDPLHRQPSTKPTKLLALSIDSVNPSSVTTTSDPNVSVTATVTNVGDQTVDDINVRMQRAPKVTTSADLRTSLQLDQQNFDVVGEFVTVSAHLVVGQSTQFTLSMPLRALRGTVPTLEITEPGVYPLLLNVNGAPQFGSEARLDDARFLLPVLGVPADPTAEDPADEAARPVAPSTAAPVATTMLWPLADRPRLAAGIPGSLEEKVRLVDDDLATSLAKGGRLEQLVSSLEFAVGPNVDRDRALSNSICLAVDPDLLVSVSNMTRGYLVLDDPMNPTGPTREGTGAQAASEWLDRVRALADNLCTVALPFAQVDLAAVRTVNDPTVSASAVTAPADVVDGILSATTVRGVIWPDSGTIDDDTGAFLRTFGTTSVVLASNAVDAGVGGLPAPDLVRIPSAVSTNPKPADPVGSDAALHAATFDVSTAAALAGVGAEPQTPSFAPADTRYDLDRDSRAARLQDALGAISWKALNLIPDQPRSQLIVPPQQWLADGNESAAVLSGVATLLRSGLATPRPFADILSRPPDPRPFELSYSQQAVDDAVPDSIRSAAASQAARIAALADALVEDPQSELTPYRFAAPLREDLLRAMSLSGRRGVDNKNGDNTTANAIGAARVVASQRAVDAMFRSVTVLSPGGTYTLASEQSPLLLVARNDLPIGIRVRLKIDAPAVMKITDIGEQQLPPRGTRPLQVPAEVADTRNLFIDVSLTTPGGHELGEPTTVSVRSNAYGQALAIITGCAGGLLLLLAGRRLLHRFRGEPDPADEGFERR
ncbi:glycoprotein [Antrihabitans stalactiti]|uniref:Glycoprotein n=1 Tax=Antrihabitans stalactiti TaxID=2584121 RepID=A0A848KCC5_9NOCA|nr:glycoprotein [Antrihabitans stalactiti]NMN95346.1 glycoprotein [Antrihabitans stalactiti]